MGMESLCWLWLCLANWLPDGVCLYLGILSARDATDCIYFSLSNTKSQETTNSLHPLPPPVPSIYIQTTVFCSFNVSNNGYRQI